MSKCNGHNNQIWSDLCSQITFLICKTVLPADYNKSRTSIPSARNPNLEKLIQLTSSQYTFPFDQIYLPIKLTLTNGNPIHWLTDFLISYAPLPFSHAAVSTSQPRWGDPCRIYCFVLSELSVGSSQTGRGLLDVSHWLMTHPTFLSLSL